MNYIDLGKKEGATCYLGGERHGVRGFFIQPTIFTDVTSEMTIMKEEIFGPGWSLAFDFLVPHLKNHYATVIVVSKFRDDEELVKLANDTLYGLAAGIFSQNISRAIKLANKIRAGTVWINMYNVLHPNVPFGGYKQSGFGRELGEYALENYTQVKAVLANLTEPAPF
jgi:aldehyde dehydrogenase (NAD+)